MTSRAYDSPLRQEQAQRTREKILEAFAQEMAAGREDFSIPRVAERAGVSTRTVYHHFPNREAQVEALAQWITRNTRGGDVAMPERLRDLPDYCERRTEMFFENEELMRAQLAAGVAQTVRARRREKRDAAIAAAVGTAGLGREDTKVVAALMKHLISAQFGVPLKDVHGLSREEIIAVMRWLTELVVRAVEKGESPLRTRR
jgi:AcrR family transcriptional regulator